VTDEQVISATERRALEANGLRVGRIIGELPPELDAMLKDEAPQRKITPIKIFVESGDQTPLISIREPVEQVALLLNRDNRVSGKPYKVASGFFRVTPRHDGAHGVALRLVPEIHHGPVRQTYQPLPGAAFTPQTFMINNGQQEEAFRELSANLALENGQVAVIGCRPEQKRSLGSFLLTQVGADGDPHRQKLILIWASRNLEGVIAEQSSKSNDRPKLFKRLVEPAPVAATPAPTSAPSSRPSMKPESPAPATAAKPQENPPPR
jgi:hypothetical protein